MSRTKRHIPQWASSEATPHALTWLGLGNDAWITKDPRNALENGYDGVSQSYYRSGYNARGWKENFQGETRKFFKRRYQKQHRAWDKWLINEALGEGEI